MTFAVMLLLAPPIQGQSPAVVAPAHRYVATASALSVFIERERLDKRVPAMSIALVDGEHIVWSRGFGTERTASGRPATANTVYRVGEVSMLLTTLAILQRAEKGQLDLDAPVRRYLPSFSPRNTSASPVTVRRLLRHTAGLVREPPVGHRSDSTSPSLAATVASLNRTSLEFGAGVARRRSDAGLAVAGAILERVSTQPFAQVMERDLFAPLSMTSSSFVPTPSMRSRVADGQRWTYHGTTATAPEFALGVAPAAGLYSTVGDLGRLLAALLGGGAASGVRVLQRESVASLWETIAETAGETRTIALGFEVDTLDGRRLVSRAGGVVGHSTHVAALPDVRLGVVISAAKDGMHALTARVAREALGQMLAARTDVALPPLVSHAPPSLTLARRVAGAYGSGDSVVRVERHDSTVMVTTSLVPTRLTLRVLAGDTLMADDGLNYAHRLWMRGDTLVLDGRSFMRRTVPTTLPDDPPVRWRGLIGEYGPDHDVVRILERDGRLHALVDWFHTCPLTELSRDVFSFPATGTHADERLVFRRDAAGRARGLRFAAIAYPRRSWIGEDGGVYRIRPAKPVADLRTAALAASPPVEQGSFLPSALTELVALDPTIRLDIRYATTRNFLSAPMYTQPRAFLQRPAAEALVRAHRRLAARGYGLLVHDGYRPWYVTKMFWDGTPPDKHDFVADPASGSRHNRGSAVDLTLYDLHTGMTVEMTGGYDEMSDRSYPQYPGGTTRQRALREILREAMESEGFTVFAAEWWHFDFKDWRQYRLGNQRFEDLAR